MLQFKHLLAMTLLFSTPLCAAEFYVAPDGSDANNGSKNKPFATLKKAQSAARLVAAKGEAVTILLRGGIHYLPEALVFTSGDSGRKNAPVVYQAAPGETPVISGGALLNLDWQPFRDGIFQAKVPADFGSDQLFVNGARQHMARYPNFDAKVRHFNGYAADAFSPQRAARWANPAGGYIHAMHRAEWGGYHYRITGKNEKGEVTYEGGWQNNRQMGMHPQFRMAENIFEELDAPGEWFHDAKTQTLYFYPPAGIDLKTATVEAVRLRHLVEFRGGEAAPVQFVTLRGLTFRHAARTFMDNKEPMLRSDWTTYRGGAVFFDGAEDCAVEDSVFDQVGGNAVFVNNYNRRVAIRGCHIFKAGGNGVAFVGDPKAVRNPLFEYNQRQSFNIIDKTPGPIGKNFPADCLVEDCLIEASGRVEKQTAGVQIEMSSRIAVRHCSIYDVPRAGINIGDGAWGGHLIEGCDVFDTVLETGDHGSFNSWGRDRFWGLKDIDLNSVTQGENKNLPLLDVVEPITLRNNRWRCDHGWDIDLDDGSSNYVIENNLCLNGGLKNREGFYRTVQNNVVVNNSFHPHVWYGNSEDIFRRNKEIDSNFLHQSGAATRPADELKKQSGRDEKSSAGDAQFINPAKGDYRVKDGSPARQTGFVNFLMDNFGVRVPKLKAIARTPKLPVPGQAVSTDPKSSRDPKSASWMGAKIKNVIGLGEISAAGLPGEIGVRLEEVPAGSLAAQAGLRAGDIILKVNGKNAHSLADFQREWRAASGKVKLDIWREQRAQTLEIAAPAALVGVKISIENSADGAFKIVPAPSGTDAATGKNITANIATNNEPLATLMDGKLAQNYGPVFGNGVSNGLYKLDLGEAKNIAQINSYSFSQNNNRGAQKFALYGSAATSDPGFDVDDAGKFTLLVTVDSTREAAAKFVASSIARDDGIGKFRWLIWAVSPVTGAQENTAWQEFDVVAAP
jgi:hypothetical protein